MESKQTPQSGQGESEYANSLGEVSHRLSDIELKLDHIIDRIRDSLHRMNGDDHWEDAS